MIIIMKIKKVKESGVCSCVNDITDMTAYTRKFK